MKKRINKLFGFTAVELLVTIVILGIVGVALAPGLGTAVQQYYIVLNSRQIVSAMSAGVDRIAREIRLIPGSAQISNIAASNFQFQYPTGTNITYSLSGTNLLRNSDVLIPNVTSLTFTYYDQTGAVTSVIANVRSVRFQVTATAPASTQGVTIQTQIFMSNTGNDYENFTSP